jgi:hypothetical protein
MPVNCRRRVSIHERISPLLDLAYGNRRRFAPAETLKQAPETNIAIHHSCAFAQLKGERQPIDLTIIMFATFLLPSYT